jgi:hypothetical protein
MEMGNRQFTSAYGLILTSTDVDIGVAKSS